MQRLIDANALRDKLQKEIDKATPPYDDVIGSIRCGVRLARNIVEDEPTIDAEPVRHGKWIRQTDTRFGEMLNDILICSECNIAFPTVNMIRRSYCPNCGAKMG